MFPRVTAILVARNGAAHLPQTLNALAGQTRKPDAFLVVDCDSSDNTVELLTAVAPTRIVRVGADASFGEAVATALQYTAPAQSDHDLLWLLAQDNAPAADALAELVAAVETAPSVAVAGPKILTWDDPGVIQDLGESLTRFGASVRLVHDELDQGQHDGLSDVLGVGPAGMLVRHRLWEHLRGFDPALPVYDDALDFSVRTRLAGFRVAVVPSAKIVSAGDGVAGPALPRRDRHRRRMGRMKRSAALHRRMAYSAAVWLPIHWLSFLPIALVRSVWHLIVKTPGLILGEFTAAFRAMFSGGSVRRARRSLAGTRVAGWKAIAALRLSAEEMRHRRAVAREAHVLAVGGGRKPLHFFSRGGGWMLLGTAALSCALFAFLFGAPGISGGGLLPLSNSVAGLWADVGYGYRDIGVGFVGAADPFSAVLAVLGTISFVSPSFALLALWFLALPLAALGAWFAASRITDRAGLCAIAGILWAIAPPLVAALVDAHPAAVLAHLLLPWLVYAAYAAPRSWSASATTAIVFAAVIACAPTLAPALLIAWVGLLVFAGRGFARVIAIPLPALVLVAPLVWEQLQRGTPLGLLADPGLPVVFTVPPIDQLVLGFPDGIHGDWTNALSLLTGGLVDAQIIIAVLVAPLAVLAVLALFLRGFRTALFAVIVAMLGLGTAVAATLISVASIGSQSVPLWSGNGLSLYWLGLVAAAICGLAALRSMAVAAEITAGIAATAAAALAVTPLAATLFTGAAALEAAPDRTLPAFVVAESERNPNITTLQLVPQPDGGIRALLERGTGTTLNDQSTLVQTATTLSDQDRQLAVLAGNLASRNGASAAEGLREFNVRFVLLSAPDTAPAADVSVPAQTTASRTAISLDGNALLTPVGQTDFGLLWRFNDAETDAVAGDTGGGEAFRVLNYIALAITFGIALLLSIPAGTAREPLAPRKRAQPAQEQAAPEVTEHAQPAGGDRDE